MGDETKSETYPRQLAVSMDPEHWRALRRMEAATGLGPGTTARLAIHKYLRANDPEFDREQRAKTGPDNTRVMEE